MPKTGDFKKVKMVRLQALVAPIHDKKLEEDVLLQGKRGRKTTKSEIIRKALDRWYFPQEEA